MWSYSVLHLCCDWVKKKVVMKGMRLCVHSLLCIVPFQAAWSDPIIDIDGPGGSITQFELSPQGKWRIALLATSSAAPVTFTITATASEPIEYVLVDSNNTGQFVFLDIGGPSGSFALPSIEDVVMAASPAGIVVLSDLRTSGDVGTITKGVGVHIITSLQCQGDLVGYVHAIGKAGSTAAGTISFLDVGGDILHNDSGDIVADIQIDQIMVAGNIGTASNTVEITAQKQIALIQASRMWADITAFNTAAPTTEGWLGRIETTGGATGHYDGTITARLLTQVTVSTPFAGLSIDGDFNGTLDLSTGGVLRPIMISDDMTGAMELGTIAAAGSLDGYLWVGDSVSGDIVAKCLDDSDAFIEILGSLTSAGSITFSDAQSLVGQVIINSASTADEWDGTIKVSGSSGTTLSPAPLYTNTSLGGGAVGEVPYSCHFGECSPAATHYGSNGIATATASTNNLITL